MSSLRGVFEALDAIGTLLLWPIEDRARTEASQPHRRPHPLPATLPGGRNFLRPTVVAKKAAKPSGDVALERIANGAEGSVKMIFVGDGRISPLGALANLLVADVGFTQGKVNIFTRSAGVIAGGGRADVGAANGEIALSRKGKLVLTWSSGRVAAASEGAICVRGKGSSHGGQDLAVGARWRG